MVKTLLFEVLPWLDVRSNCLKVFTSDFPWFWATRIYILNLSYPDLYQDFELPGSISRFWAAFNLVSSMDLKIGKQLNVCLHSQFQSAYLALMFTIELTIFVNKLMVLETKNWQVLFQLSRLSFFEEFRRGNFWRLSESSHEKKNIFNHGKTRETQSHWLHIQIYAIGNLKRFF